MPLARISRLWIALGVAAAAIAIGAGALAWTSRRQTIAVAMALTDGDPARGPALIRRYGCSGCHTIGGVPGGNGQVGGSLDGIRSRVYVGGVLFNSPDNLVRWIVSPPSHSPRTAMPVTGITETEARDVAAYLYTR